MNVVSVDETKTKAINLRLILRLKLKVVETIKDETRQFKLRPETY